MNRIQYSSNIQTTSKHQFCQKTVQIKVENDKQRQQ